MSGYWGLPGGSVIKNLPAVQETQVWSLGQEDLLKKEMTTHSSIRAREIPWTEEPQGLQSVVSQSSTQLSNWRTIRVFSEHFLFSAFHQRHLECEDFFFFFFYNSNLYSYLNLLFYKVHTFTFVIIYPCKHSLLQYICIAVSLRI